MSATQIQYSVQPAVEERRRWPRMKVPVQAELWLEGRDVPIRVETADLSVGGCYIEMMFTLSVGDMVEVILWIGDRKLVTKGQVVTCHPHFGNGIKFLNMGSEEELLLAAYLGQEMGTSSKSKTSIQ